MLNAISDFVYFAKRWKPFTVTFNHPSFLWRLSRKRRSIRAARRTTILSLFFLLLVSCYPVQKTLHKATLGLIKDPEVSEQAKVALLTDQQSSILRSEQMKPYHGAAIVTFGIGLTIFIVGRVGVPWLEFLDRKDSNVGLIVIAGAACISVFSVVLETLDIVLLGRAIIWLGIVGAIFFFYRLASRTLFRANPRSPTP